MNNAMLSTTPLKIIPLVDVSFLQQGDSDHDDSGGWRVLHRLVTAHPRPPCVGRSSSSTCDTGSIETLWQLWTVGTRDGDNYDGSNSGAYESSMATRTSRVGVTSASSTPRMRIVVASGPGSVFQRIHASFELPPDAQLPIHLTALRSAICWATFPSYQDHPILCALVNPTSVILWDVFPYDTKDDFSTDSNSPANPPGTGDNRAGVSHLPAEGWTVTLPFECCSIHPAGIAHGCGGIILQRLEDEQDITARVWSMESTNPRGDLAVNDEDNIDPKRQVDDEGDDEEEDGFILRPPPHLSHLTSKNLGVACSVPAVTSASGGRSYFAPSTTMTTPRSHRSYFTHPVMDGGLFPGGQPAAVPSLFSLQHPLQDVLPVYELLSETTQEQKQEPPHSQALRGTYKLSPMLSITDVFEKVIWVGTATWAQRGEGYLDRKVHSQVLAVSYHVHYKRHAIWVVCEAPPGAAGPPEVPLFKRTKQLHQQQPNALATVGAMDDGAWLLRDVDLLDAGTHDQNHLPFHTISSMPTSFSSTTAAAARHYAGVPAPMATTSNRHEALAEALGIGRRPSPRADQSMTAVVSAGPTGTGWNVQRPRTESNTSGALFLFSPDHSVASQPRDHCPPHNKEQHSDQQAHHANSAMTMTAPTLGPVANLHPRMVISCLYQQPVGSAEEAAAESVFLASNQDASGTLLLCLVVEEKASAANEVQKELRGKSRWLTMFELHPPHQQEKITLSPWRVTKRERIHCRSAHPIHFIPMPVCFRPHPKNIDRQIGYDVNAYMGSTAMATDMIVHTMSDELIVYRCEHAVVPIELPYFWHTAIDGSENAFVDSVIHVVRDQITIAFRLSGIAKSFRGKLSISSESDAMIERALLAMESALVVAYQQQSQLLNSNTPELLNLSLLLRCDFVRLMQALDETTVNSRQSDSALLAFQSLISSVAQFELSVTSDIPSLSEMDTAEVVDEWQFLLDSQFYHEYSSHEMCLGRVQLTNQTSMSPDITLNIPSSMKLSSIELLTGWTTNRLPVLPLLFDSLHMLYEDFKLSASSAVNLARLQSILELPCRYALANGHDPLARRFLDYYEHDNAFEQVTNVFVGEETDKRFTSFSSPPSIMSHLENSMTGRQRVTFYESAGIDVINASCTRSLSLCRIYSMLFVDPSPSRNLDAVNALLEEGFSESAFLQEELAVGVVVPILEVLHRCRNDAQLSEIPGWTPAAWTLVGRQDLSRNLTASEGYGELTRQIGIKNLDDQRQSAVDDNNDRDGLAALEHSSGMLFPDNRVHEAARLLRSSRPIFLRVSRAIEVTDHDYERMKQKKLLSLCRRALAVPIGRGMLTIGSLKPVPAEPLPIPDICLKGRVPPTNATIALDMSDCPSDMSVWPEFHNGVAAGLRLPMDGESGSNLMFPITRSWIVYNRPPVAHQDQQEDGDDEANAVYEQRNHAHGGFLLALGLRGHLTVLEMSDLYEYLTQGTLTTTVGVLLGMAANKRGSCDMSVSKMLCLHIPSLIPHHFNAIDVASTVQAAAVAGAGFLFQKSSHRMMTEFLLNEIGKRPQTDANVFDRESYTLSCGLALGMVNLVLNEKSHDVDRAAGIADLHIEERLQKYIVGGIDTEEFRRTRESNDRFSIPASSTTNDSEKCSTVHEGELINTDMTAPAATLALGLIYMKSGNQAVASAVAVPDTHFTLEFVRPDFITLRLIARALILWNDVQATEEWMEQQIPSVVRKAYAHMCSIAKKATEGHVPLSKSRFEFDYDRQAVRQIYVHSVAGACFGLALRYAGTGDASAKALISDRLMELYALRESTDAVSAATRPDFPILETCLSCVAVSLAMILAGTGDLDTLRLFKMLRWRCEADNKFGHHMIYGMATGLLFLGGGTCTLGRDPEDIAALLAAFFPRFPMTTSDNQYHLQALRHFYALAVRRKHLRAIDVDTSASVAVTVEQIVNGDKKREITLPCLLLNSDDGDSEIRVSSDIYYPLRLKLEHRRGDKYTIFVKKRSNPHAKMVDTLTGYGRIASTINIPSYHPPSYQCISAYAEYFSNNKNNGRLLHHEPSNWLSTMIVEGHTDGTEEALLVYLALGLSSPSSCCTLAHLWNLRLIRTYYQQQHYRHSVQGLLGCHNLMDITILATLFERTELGLATRSDVMKPIS